MNDNIIKLTAEIEMLSKENRQLKHEKNPREGSI